MDRREPPGAVIPYVFDGRLAGHDHPHENPSSHMGPQPLTDSRVLEAKLCATRQRRP